MTDYTGAFFHKTGPSSSANNQHPGGTLDLTGPVMADSSFIPGTLSLPGSALGGFASGSGGGGGGGGDGDGASTPIQVWSDG